MTRQEIFDKVIKHLLTQMQYSQDEEGFCRYRTDQGLKCAIGCLIKDNEYELSMEYRPVDNLIDAFPQLNCKIFNMDNLSFLKQLQRIHDQQPTRIWADSLKCLAMEFNLKFNWE